MCGRYTLHALPADVSARFSLAKSWFTLTPRFNIAPTQSIAAIIQTEEGRVLTGFQWGLIPSWTKAANTNRPLINAHQANLSSGLSPPPLSHSRRWLFRMDWTRQETRAGLPPIKE
jgi:putative SOS response-associated peptidase YedK